MREELTAVSEDRQGCVGTSACVCVCVCVCVSTRCRRGETGESTAASVGAGNEYNDIQYQY